MSTPLSTYEPGVFLNPEARDTPPYALLILNQPITDKTLFLRLWKNGMWMAFYASEREPLLTDC